MIRKFINILNELPFAMNTEQEQINIIRLNRYKVNKTVNVGKIFLWWKGDIDSWAMREKNARNIHLVCSNQINQDLFDRWCYYYRTTFIKNSQ